MAKQHCLFVLNLLPHTHLHTHAYTHTYLLTIFLLFIIDEQRHKNFTLIGVIS